MTAKLEEREFEFGDEDFRHIVQLVSQKTGIVLGEHKRPMVYSRLARRLRALKFTAFRDYLHFLEREEGQGEIVDFVNAITTNLTSFFREGHHFEHLEKTVLKPLLANKNTNRRLRIWSAGCSSGMEPYTISMVLNEYARELASWDVKILATDIDTNMINTGKAGIYSEDCLEKIPARFKKYVIGTKNDEGDDVIEMSDKLKNLITFKQLNLLEEWPIKGPFDVIFCRNVVIYFDKETQRGIFDRYANLIKPDGWLYIGHSENLFNVCDRFSSKGKTIYQKIK